jgi:hypothetical protein
MTPSEREEVLMARAQRRLVEFELVERKVLLGLTVLLVGLVVVGALTSGPLFAAASTAASVVSGGTLVLRARHGSGHPDIETKAR